MYVTIVYITIDALVIVCHNNNMLKVSNSKLDTALQCPWAYYVNTRMRSECQYDTESMLIGKLIHRVAERYMLETTSEERHGRRTAGLLQIVCRIRDDEFVDTFNQGVLDLVLKYLEEYNDAIEDTKSFGTSIGKVYKAPTWTNYWQRTYGERFIAIDNEVFLPLRMEFPNVIFQSSFLEIYNYIEKCCNNIVKVCRQMEEGSTIYLEYKPDARVAIHGAAFTAVYDRVDILPDRVIISDIKTGRWQYDSGKVRNSRQLNLYAYIYWQQNGVLPEVQIIDLNRAEITRIKFTEDELIKFIDCMKGVVRYVKALDSKIARSADFDDVVHAFPLPIGKFGGGCPCILADVNNPKIKCPYYRTEV